MNFPKWFYYSVAAFMSSADISPDDKRAFCCDRLTFAKFTAFADHLNLLAFGACHFLAVDVETDQVAVGTCTVVAFMFVIVAMLVFDATLDARFCKVRNNLIESFNIDLASLT